MCQMSDNLTRSVHMVKSSRLLIQQCGGVEPPHIQVFLGATLLGFNEVYLLPPFPPSQSAQNTNWRVCKGGVLLGFNEVLTFTQEMRFAFLEPEERAPDLKIIVCSTTEKAGTKAKIMSTVLQYLY